VTAGDHEAWTAVDPRALRAALLRGLREACALQPGASELLGRLRAAGLRLGLVSDYRGVPERLAALGLAASSFDFVLVTEELGAMKPAPRMVEATLAGMGQPGSAMVMVGDRAFADQRFAEAAGMRFLGVRGARGAARARAVRWVGRVHLGWASASRAACACLVGRRVLDFS
jgi:FMN phosphatase YigB (HAD superfamily)